MIIKSIMIKNFRCIRELSIEFSDLTAFVGRNGSGKSTILQALGIFYNVKASLSEHDFFNGDFSLPIEITVEYRELNSAEQVEFTAYVNDGSLAVLKRISLRDGRTEQKYFASTKQIPEIAAIRHESGVIAKRTAWNNLISAATLPDVGPTSVRGDDPEVLMLAYEQYHPELGVWTPQEVQFFGPPNIGGGKLDNFTKFVYVPAVRDASEDSSDKKGSSLFQLLDFIVLRRFRSRQDVRALQSEFSTRLKELYDPVKLTEFNELATQISNTLKIYVPNAQLGLQLAEPALPEIPSPATIAQLVEDDYAGAIDRKGHGLQRALIFSLLQHLAVAKPIEGSDEPEDTIEDASGSPGQNSEDAIDEIKSVVDLAGPDLIIAIEEPELYQHPLRAKHLARVLMDMSRTSTMGPGGRNQIVYTTHSPYFVDLERFDQLRMIRKFKQEPAEPPCTNAISYSLQNAAEKMAQLTGKPAGQFTAQSFRARAYPVMTQSVNEGFFADKVVLVEGDTEVAALLTVAHRIGHDWLSKGIAVVPVGGKTKIDRAAVIFSGLQIPTYIIFDGDCRHKGKKEEAEEKVKNRLLLRLCEADEEDFPPTLVSTKHACFEDDFETYCKQIIGQTPYECLREDAGKKHGFDRPTDGIKNFDVVVDLVNAVYELGHKLVLLEEIIEKVNCLGTRESPVVNISDAGVPPEIKIAA